MFVAKDTLPHSQDCFPGKQSSITTSPPTIRFRKASYSNTLEPNNNLSTQPLSPLSPHARRLSVNDNDILPADSLYATNNRGIGNQDWAIGKVLPTQSWPNSSRRNSILDIQFSINNKISSLLSSHELLSRELSNVITPLSSNGPESLLTVPTSNLHKVLQILTSLQSQINQLISLKENLEICKKEATPSNPTYMTDENKNYKLPPISSLTDKLDINIPNSTGLYPNYGKNEYESDDPVIPLQFQQQNINKRTSSIDMMLNPVSIIGNANNKRSKSVSLTTSLPLDSSDRNSYKLTSTAPAAVQSDFIRDFKLTRISSNKCLQCGETQTPEWRRGPYGNKTLCNACGLFYSKLTKKFGNKNANLLMRYRQKTSPSDRKVPVDIGVPDDYIQLISHDTTLDQDYFTQQS
ncbi:hypothetical protein Kpol_1046p6 [Vanderwaltozyma polyspora DSM 70294]|uniref:GATA-type domain-containing protein n=1 Tax=Vanderwaltozyma polyspora (strain ATCC 22028 / DSM 70294 / BCRC 21397 / CBS 2163 / NBRC 10782 / NRRL Y-8283 / UCD 57-17) TaxID=436907 RepID=A7TRI7_VANPO|nr:uncharacterized protein Kpol_1046p6 [Vanderwaltozyma polyspora DSM 70294]EDO15116.1 hypothetical protein Kpol_1046p6 [Vanderwaltozyma polyspora DSM 70294]